MKEGAGMRPLVHEIEIEIAAFARNLFYGGSYDTVEYRNIYDFCLSDKLVCSS